jgi:hypothetical protein
MPYAVAVLRGEQVTGSEGPPQAVGDFHLDGRSQHHHCRECGTPLDASHVRRDLPGAAQKTGTEGVLAPLWAAIRIAQ